MKFGINLANFGPYGEARVVAEMARDAEQAGWDGFFIWDHVAPDVWWPQNLVDPWIALTAAAMVTQSIRLGTLVTPLPRRRPWKVARETVSLDRLSGGRLTLGVGIGVRAMEWDNLGEEANLKARGAMLDEALDVLIGLWSGEKFSYDGAHYHVSETCFQPTPVQTPHIPIWVAGFWPNKAPFRRAARWDGLCPIFGGDPATHAAQLGEAVAFVQAQMAEDKPFDVVYTGHSLFGNSRAQAAEIIKPFADAGLTWWLEDTLPLNFWNEWDGSWPLETFREMIRQGPPAL